MSNVRRFNEEKNKIKKLKPEEQARFPLNPLIENDMENLYHWIAIINGPAGTPYEGGKIKVNIYITDGYPSKAPIVSFEPICFHTSIDPKSGQPCLDILNDWKPTKYLCNICLSLYELLQNPSAVHEVNTEAVNLFKDDHKKYIEKAEQWTRDNAK